MMMIVSEFTGNKFRFYSFLSMFLLVYVHAYNLNETYLQPFSLVHEPITITTFFEYFTANGLFRFRIPMLFVISGYLYALHDEKPYWQRIRKRARTLLAPYLLWSAIALIITFLLQQFPLTARAVKEAQIDQMGDNRPYTEIGWSGLFTRWILVPTAFQLWFIRVLFVYNLLYPLLKRAVVTFPVFWFVFAVLFWMSMIGLHFIEGEGLLFFTLGIWICKNNFNIEQPPKWMSLTWTAPFFIVGCAVKTILAFYLKESTLVFMAMAMLHKMIVFTGLVTMWYGCNALVKACMSRQWFVWLTSFAFIIYALHVPLVNYSTKLVFSCVHQLPNYRLLTYLLLPLVIILFCVLTGALLRKISPTVYGWMTGGRGLI